MSNISNILWFFSVMTNNAVIGNIEITSGIYLESLPNISFYQTTRQIIFRVRKNSAIIDQFRCRESFCARFPHMCDPLTQRWDYFKHLHNNPSAVEENILSNDGELFDYQLATRSHLKKMFASDYEIKLLVEKFGKRDHITFREIKFPTLIINDENISCTDIQFKELVRKDLELQYEHSRQLVTMCQLKRLALDFIALDKLGKILKELNVELQKTNYVLALASITQFYTMPLIECIMSSNTILVGIHIPLLKKDLQGLHMMKILTPAYAWENFTCSVNVPVVNVALLQNNSTWKIFVPKCDPIKEELCYISDHRNEDNLGISCVQQTLRGGSFKQFATNCPILCRETGNDTQYMTPLNSHRLLITRPTKTLRLKCRDTTHILPHEGRIGTLSIDVPCHCQLEDDEHQIYPTYSCVDTLRKFGHHQQIPAAWTRYGGLSLPKWGDPPLYFDKLSDCWNELWINSQFPGDQVPLTTYFLIILFLLVLTSLTISLYLIYKSRISFENHVQRTSQRTFTRNPMPILNPRHRPLPQPIEEELELEETENEYLQPTEVNLPIQTPPIIHAYVPRPVGEASTSGTNTDTGYVKMDRLRAMFYARNPR